MKKTLFALLFIVACMPHAAYADRMFTSGFEKQSNTAGVEFSSNGLSTGGVAVDGIRRTGQTAMRINSSAAENSWFGHVYKAVGSGAGKCRVYIYIADLPASGNFDICAAYDATAVDETANVRLKTDGTLQLLNDAGTQVGSASAALSLNTWYCVQLEYTPGAGTAVYGAYVSAANSACVGTSTANAFARTTTGTGANFSAFYMGTPFATDSSLDIYFDDWAINDAATTIQGTSQSGLPPDGKVVSLMVTRNGDNAPSGCNNTSPCGSAGNEYQYIDEKTPDDATSFIDMDTAINADFELQNSTSTIATSSAIYWFDGSVSAVNDPNGGWTGDANAFDSNSASQATSSSGVSSDYLMATGTNAIAPSFEIQSVRIRIIGQATVSGFLGAYVTLDGVELSTTESGFLGNPDTTGAWATVDVPSGGWTISKVQNLGIYTQAGAVNDAIGMVQLVMDGGIDSYDTINLVQNQIRIREETAAATSYALRMKSSSGGTTLQTAATDAGNTTWRTNPTTTNLRQDKRQATTTMPGTGTAWVTSGTDSLDNAQIGVSMTTGTADFDVSTMWLNVEFTDGTAPAGTAAAQSAHYFIDTDFRAVDGSINISD